MTKEAIKYAMKNLLIIAGDNDVKFHEGTNHLGIYVEFKSGRNLSISDDEIYHQAEEYLDHQKATLKWTR